MKKISDKKKFKKALKNKNAKSKVLLGFLMGQIALLSGCGRDNSLGGGEDSEKNPTRSAAVGFNVKAACNYTNCNGSTATIVFSDPTGSGTLADPLTAGLCAQTVNSFDPLIIDVSNATNLNCTTTSNINIQLSNTTSIELKAAAITAPETFNCTAGNADGSKTFYFNLSGDSCGGGCFTPETQVLMADGSKKRLIEIESGEKVIGRNGEINRVTEVEKIRLPHTQLYSLNGSGPFVTSAHSFMTINGWKAIDPLIAQSEHPELGIIEELTAGDVLILENEETMFLETISKGNPLSDFTVYNLAVDGNATYYVSFCDRMALVSA